jgi:hypothetical protein
MQTPPGSSARREGWFPDGAGADPPPELDDRQGFFDGFCVPAHHAPTRPLADATLICYGAGHVCSVASRAPWPRDLTRPPRREEGRVRFFYAPPRLHGGPLVHLQSKRMIAWRKAP